MNYEVYDNKKMEMLASGYNAAQEMERRIKSGVVIKDVIDAVKDYLSVTRRRVTFEYILLEGVNDSKKITEKNNENREQK